MADFVASAIDDELLEQLQYKAGKGASYVDRRESCSFFPLGSNVYSATNGNKVLRIAINSDGFLDPSTVRFNFTLVNKATGVKRLRPLSGAWSWWRRLRVLCNQTVCEDILDYNKLHEQYEQLQNTNVRNNDDVMSYDGRWDLASNGVGLATNSGPPIESLPGITAGSSRPCTFTLLSGLLGSSNSKYIPLKYAPIIVEIEITSRNDDCIITPIDLNTNPLHTYHFTTTNTSTEWEIVDCQIKADIIYLNSAVAEAYEAHLSKADGFLPIKYTTYNTLSQSITGAGNQLSINVARSCVRLKHVFASFYNNTQPRYWLKQFNQFLHPMWKSEVVDGTGSFPAYDPNFELEWQIQTGSRFYPSYPVRSTAEAFTHLLKTLNYPDKYQHSSNINPITWRSTKFVMAYDFEKMRDGDFTGINTSSGDLMIIRVKASPLVNTGAAQNVNTSGFGDNMFIVLVSDNILKISLVGTQVEG